MISSSAKGREEECRRKNKREIERRRETEKDRY